MSPSLLVWTQRHQKSSKKQSSVRSRLESSRDPTPTLQFGGGLVGRSGKRIQFTDFSKLFEFRFSLIYRLKKNFIEMVKKFRDVNA